MQFFSCPRFPFTFREAKIETTNTKSFSSKCLSETCSKSNNACKNENVVTGKHTSDQVEPKNKQLVEPKNNIAVTIDVSVGSCFVNEKSAASIENSISKSCSETSYRKTYGESSNQMNSNCAISPIKIGKTNDKFESKQLRSGSKKKYSDCQTQTKNEIGAKNDSCQEHLPKNNKKPLLSRLIEKIPNIEISLDSKNTNQKFCSFFSKKSDKKLEITDKIKEIDKNHHEFSEHADVCSENTSIEDHTYRVSDYVNCYDAAVNNSESSSHGSSLKSVPIRDSNSTLEKQDSKYDILHISANNVHALKAKSGQRCQSDSDILSIQSNARINNHLKIDSIFLDSSHKTPRKGLTSVNIEKAILLCPGIKSSNDISQIHRDNRTLIDQRFESELVNNNFIRRKEFMNQNSLNTINSFDNLDDKIFHFNRSEEFLDEPSDASSSASDEVFLRPRKNDDRLDNGLQITRLVNGSNFSSMNSVLPRNYYHSEEYIHKDPPPSPENSHHQSSFIRTCSETLSKCDSELERLEQTNFPNVDLYERHSQENSEIMSTCFEERNLNTSLDYKLQYQSKTLSKMQQDSESAHVRTDSLFSVVRSDSKGSSGYDSMEIDTGSFAKHPLQAKFRNGNCQLYNNFDDNCITNKNIESELKIAFELSQTTSRNTYSHLESVEHLPTTSRDHYTYSSSERKQHNVHNRTLLGEIYPPIKNDVAHSTTDLDRSPCRKIHTDEHVCSSSNRTTSVESSKEYLYNERKILHQQPITSKDPSLTNPSPTPSLENFEIQKAVIVEKLYKPKRTNTFPKHFGASIGDVKNSDCPNKTRKASNLSTNGEICCSCKKPPCSFRKKVPVPNRDPSDYTVFKFYGFIDGHLAPVCVPKTIIGSNE